MSTEVARASFVSKTSALVVKDLRVEARARSTLLPMLAFAFSVVLVLAFALPGTNELGDPVDLPIGAVPVANVLSGFLWITILFAGLIGFARTFEVEREMGALDPLLLAPLDRSALFASKAIANLAFIIGLEVFLLPAFALMFGLDLGSSWLPFMGVVLLADVGFVAVGTLFASLAAGTRSRELILPILALPALVPLFIASTELTTELFAGGAWDEVTGAGWFAILGAYDIVFATAGALVFEFTLD